MKPTTWKNPSDPPLRPSFQAIIDETWAKVELTDDAAYDFLRLSKWTIEECKLAVLGIDPAKLKKYKLVRVLSVLKIKNAYDDLEVPFSKAQATGELADQNPPLKFLRWAKANQIGVHHSILSIAYLLDEPPKRGAVGHVAASKARSDKSLYQMLFAVAVRRYRYDPNKRNSDVPAKIQSDLEQLGLHLDVATIKSHLKKATEIVNEIKSNT